MELEKCSERGPKNNGLYLYFCAFALNLVSLACGTVSTWASPVLAQLTDSHNIENNPLRRVIDTSEASLIASLISVGGMIGPCFGAYLSNKIGRKKTMLIITFPLFISFLMTCFASTVIEFYIVRILAGIVFGSLLAVIPNYLAEISENHNRGMVTCLLATNISLGNLIPFAIGPLLTIPQIGIVCLVPIVMFYVLVVIFVPESPYYMMQQRKDFEAEDIIKRLRRRSNVKEEYLELKNIIEKSLNGKSNGIKDMLVNKNFRRGILITTCLIFFQQFSGINAVLSYMQTIFESTGSKISPHLSPIFVGLVQFTTTCILPMVVDRLGRKLLLLISSAGSAVSLFLIGIFFYLKDSTILPLDCVSWLPIVSLVCYSCFYAAGLGALPWTILGEIFDANSKAYASIIIASLCFVFSFTVTALFPYMVLIDTATTFWIFAFISLLSGIFVIYKVPETKGKTFLEILEMLNK